MGRWVRTAMDTAREQVAGLLDVSASQIIFTSGGTEANNLVFRLLPTLSGVAVSAIEHPSILEPAAAYPSTQIQVDQEGKLDLNSLDRCLQMLPRNSLVSMMLANNETGVIQDFDAITERLKQYPVLLHTDAVQAVGKIPVSFRNLGLDLMSVSSHKLYGPKGCGALVVHHDIMLDPLIKGGGQEKNLRSGTENVAAIIGFGQAAELARQELTLRRQQMLKLRTQLEAGLKTINNTVIFSETVERLPNTVQFAIPDTSGEMLLMQLDQKNIAVSSGSACAAGGGKPSTVLSAMGIDSILAKAAIRVTLGKNNTEDEITSFIHTLKSIINRR